MNADRYQRVKELFFAACAEPADRRKLFLDRVCADDTSLRVAVEELLANDQNPVNLSARHSLRPHLEHFANAETTAPIADAPPLPARIGGFRILDTLGGGGMGVVYRAEQDHPKRIVALKVVTPGQATASTLRRFGLEAQMLGRLKHPGIAHIYEAGTGDWGGGVQPYFAMELVNGRPLIQYVEQIGLDTRQRLELFLQVCDAVEHAHQRGIIHRDLKPANILLDESTTPVQPKVLDFGVARAIDSDLERTSFRTSANQIIGTVAYMSPEQVSGDPHDLDTRSDVYSLGIVLYELLSGRLPYDLARKSVAEAVHIITHDEPAMLATTNRSFRGDLNTIVGRAMSHDKTRRYQSVRDLARDLRHYLKDEPIEARRDSALYVLRKTLRRYRVPVAALAAVIIVTMVSAVVAWTLFVREQRASKEARDAQQQVEDRLHESLILQARASRRTGMSESRGDALAALSRAAQIRPTLEVRNEAIAAMSLPGLTPLPLSLPNGPSAVDADFQTCAVMTDDQSSTIYRIEDGSVVATVSKPDPLPADPILIHLCQLTNRYFMRGYDVPGKGRRVEVWRIPEADLWMEFDDLPDRSRSRISPDQRTLAVPRSDRTIGMYDLASRTETKRFDLDHNAGYLQFDPTGRWLAQFHGLDTTASVLDLQTGERSPVFSGASITWALEWSRDGALMAAASVQRIHLWDVAEHRMVGELEGHFNTIVQLQFSPDGSLLASYSWDGEAILWDVRRRQLLMRMPIMVLGWSPDGHRVLGTGSSRIPLCHVDMGGEFAAIAGHHEGDAYVNWPKVVFDPSGRFLVTGSTQPTSLRVFDLQSQKEIARAEVGSIFDMQTDRTGTRLVTSSDHGLCMWPLSSEPEGLHIGPPQQVSEQAFDSDIDISGSGQFVAYAGPNGVGLRVADLHDLQSPSWAFPHAALMSGPVLNGDGRWLAIGNWNGQNVEVWDVRAQKRIQNLTTDGSTIARFSPDDRFLATSDRSQICLWDTVTWSKLRTMKSLQTATLSFSPDGAMIATAAKGQIQLVDTRDMTELATFVPPNDLPPRSVVFSADGSMLVASTTSSHIVLVWNLRLIRERLSSMGLDWDLPSYPPEELEIQFQPLQIEIDQGVFAQTQHAEH